MAGWGAGTGWTGIGCATLALAARRIPSRFRPAVGIDSCGQMAQAAVLGAYSSRSWDGSVGCERRLSASDQETGNGIANRSLGGGNGHLAGPDQPGPGSEPP